LIVTSICAAGGLRLDRWLAISLNVAPFRFLVIHTPSRDYLTGIENMIASARHEVVIATPKIDAEEVLDAARVAEGRGVRVVFVFSPDAVNPNSGALGWLMYYKVGTVFTDKIPFSGTTIVADGQVALVSALPVTVRSKALNSGGFEGFIKYQAGAMEIRGQILEQAARGKVYRTNTPAAQ
jgi:hypothetical protein